MNAHFKTGVVIFQCSHTKYTQVEWRPRVVAQHAQLLDLGSRDRVGIGRTCYVQLYLPTPYRSAEENAETA